MNAPRLSLSPEEAEALVAPYVMERMPASDPRFRALRGRLLRKWTWRLLRRRLLGWRPGVARTQDYVAESYTRTWIERGFPQTHGAPPDPKPSPAAWRDKGLVVRRGGLARAHLLVMARAIEALAPRSVLEVGSGNGLNLFVLAARFPEVAWTGVELTESGVAAARAVQQEERLPQMIADYAPWPVADPAAHRRIDVRQGDATRLPFADSSFDLVITRQALEQMESVRDAALAEIARVARGPVLMAEPFADFNRDYLRRTYVAAKDYFSLPVEGLRRFGIEPEQRFADYPQNLLLGIGVVLGRVARPRPAQ